MDSKLYRKHALTYVFKEHSDSASSLREVIDKLYESKERIRETNIEDSSYI